jgi:hypothetical protein
MTVTNSGRKVTDSGMTVTNSGVKVTVSGIEKPWGYEVKSDKFRTWGRESAGMNGDKFRTGKATGSGTEK